MLTTPSVIQVVTYPPDKYRDRGEVRQMSRRFRDVDKQSYPNQGDSRSSCTRDCISKGLVRMLIIPNNINFLQLLIVCSLHMDSMLVKSYILDRPSLLNSIAIHITIGANGKSIVKHSYWLKYHRNIQYDFKSHLRFDQLTTLSKQI